MKAANTSTILKDRIFTEKQFPCYTIAVIAKTVKEGGRLIKKAGNLFTTAYLLLIFGVYPFYMKQGYVDIGKAKYYFFIYSSLAALGIFALISILLVVQNIYQWLKKRKQHLADWDKLSSVDLFVIMFATEIFISYTLSDFRKEALWGTEGWYMGLVLKLTLCALYFMISRLWDGSRSVWYTVIAASGAVFFLGILDRFSIYLIPLEIRQPEFISTIGNINWFSGYLSVLAPIGICMFLFQNESNFKKLLFGIYAVVSFMAGLSQGGDSIFIFFAALFFILLWISINKNEWLRNYFLLIFLWGFSAQMIRLMRFLMPDSYNYDTNNLCAYATGTNITLIVGILGLVVYGILIWKKEKFFLNERIQKMVKKAMCVFLFGGVVLWLVLAEINTFRGILGLEEKSFLLLNENWGNGRGAAILVAFMSFKQMPVLHKILGTGPDCFSVYVYSLPDVAVKLREAFGDSRLTNAHNELLTCLVNEGILGVCLFLGIMIFSVKNSMKKGDTNYIYYAMAVCVICYLCHNMVSFEQVLNLPFLFLLMGMGRAESQSAEINFRIPRVE